MSSFRVPWFLLLLVCFAGGVQKNHNNRRDGSSQGFKTYFDDFREGYEDPGWFTTLHSASHQPPQKVDLLECLNLRNRSIPGLSYHPGPHSPSPATYFDSSPRGAAFISVEKCFWLGQLLKGSPQVDLALLTSLRQKRGNAGTLLSIVDSTKNLKLLELQSSGRQNVLRLHYLSSWSASGNVIETIPVTLADDKWHRLAISISGDQLNVYLDCRPVFHKIIHPFKLFGDSKKSSLQNISLWVGQSSRNHFLYKGYLQNFHLVTGQNGHLVQCPTAEVNCPTCGEFRNLQDVVQNLVHSHQREIMLLQQELKSIQSRLRKVEDCDCAKSCRTDRGHVYEDGSTWMDNCQSCSCNRGKVDCESLLCPEAHCDNPKPADPSSGICCAKCENCFAFGQVYEHGSSVSPKQCVTCSCDNGDMKCETQDTEENPCPALDCPLEEQILVHGKCCKTCKADFCALGNDCHIHANCINLSLNYTCACRSGFRGDGKNCEDINECDDHRGDSGTQPCKAQNSVCVNTLGSYSCECEEGYNMEIVGNGSLSCRRKDICQTSPWPCHSNATCLNTSPGEFECRCLQGFLGDGVKRCLPQCESRCENGGTCIEPGLCLCPPGFRGAQCERDIDECIEGFNRCGGEARCVNKPGWYYCQCRSGYRTYQDPESIGQTICIDEDECEMGSHSCHPSTSCINVDGSYECQCDQNKTCSQDCVMEDGKELVGNGTSWPEGCNTCLCIAGKISCSPPQCDCSKNPDRGCCPECYDIRTCLHVPESGNDSSSRGPETFGSGERWLENCRECECLHGEVDCWPMDCPPIPSDCANLVTLEGDCCPTCSMGVSWSSNATSNKSQPCNHGGLLRMNGERWALEDECTQCDCKMPCCDQLVSSSTKISSRTVLYIALLALHVTLWILGPPLTERRTLLRTSTISPRIPGPSSRPFPPILHPCSSFPLRDSVERRSKPLELARGLLPQGRTPHRAPLPFISEKCNQNNLLSPYPLLDPSFSSLPS